MPVFPMVNARLFIWFRIFYNTRWYYPVLAVMFLDQGITTEQYALLNVAWAIAIVLLEVPSGALADRVGRKKLVVTAALLMVAEMAILSFAPLNQPGLLFALFLLNRVLSGASEAAASGADEALAYDSLPEETRAGQWPQILERLQRLQSLAFFGAMMLGALLYDAAFVNGILRQWEWEWPVETIHRLPAYLTLGNALAALVVALRMREIPRHIPDLSRPISWSKELWQGTLEAGHWIRRTPFVFFVLLMAVIHDCVIRIFLTMSSQYYRLIQIPDVFFGLVGAAFALVGLATAGVARRMVKRWTPATNFLVLSAVAIAAFGGLCWQQPIWGIAFVLMLGGVFQALSFFLSTYLNESADPRQRATILSFRGLAINLAYGSAGTGFALLAWNLRRQGVTDEMAILALSLPWLLASLAAAVVLTWLRGRQALAAQPTPPARRSHHQSGGS